MRRPLFVFNLLVLLTLLIGSGRLIYGAETLPEKTTLDDYIQRPDDSFTWKVLKTKETDDMKTFVLDMTSQTWRGKEEVDRTAWQHWITIAVPKKAKSKIGFMWIGGGGNGGNPPEGPSEMIQQIAKATNTVVAEIHMIPNQTLVFHKDGQRRVEDDLIAYTWVKFLETGDPTWSARNAMVKAVIRAMDAVSALMASDEGGNKPVENYVVAGASKRGWTTWLVGAVDKRVVGIAPIVIDILNLQKSMGHHFSAYGFFAPSLGDYVEHNIVKMVDHPRLGELFAFEDPFHYRHRLKIPKFIVNATGDQFFTPDMSRFYFDDLQGEKFLRYVPNANHSLNGSDAVESLISFYSMILAGRDRPKFSWTRPDNNTFIVKTVDKPKNVILWQATNPEARDFRLESLGPKFTSQTLEAGKDGTFVGKVSDPKKGFTAFFVELTYDVGLPTSMKATTNVGIVPDVLPFKDKDPTLATSVTIYCQAPSQAVVDQIKALIASPEMQAVAEDTRFSINGPGEEGAISITLNWLPKGRYEKGEAVVGQLEKLGCKKLDVRFESGRPKVGK